MQPWKLLADPSGYIFTWLLGYSGGLGSIAGVLIADYWLVRTTRARARGPLPRRRGLHATAAAGTAAAVVATLVGCALAWGGLVVPAAAAPLRLRLVRRLLRLVCRVRRPHAHGALLPLPPLARGARMSPTTLPASTLTGEEMVALCRKHTIYEWSAQSKVDPIPVARAEGVYFWTPEGKRYLDFNSQLMCSNIGHSHPKVVRAIQEQAAGARLRQPVHGHGAAGPPGSQARDPRPGRHGRLLLHERRRGGQRERDPHRARGDRPPQGAGAVPLLPRRAPRGRSRSPGTRAAGPRSRGSRASCGPPTSTSGAAASPSRSRPPCASSRTSSATRADRTSRPS